MANEIVVNPKYEGYKRGLSSVVYKILWQENSIRGSMNE